MATRIKPKRGSGAPTTANLEANEIAMDVLAKKLYVHNGTDVVVLAENISNNDINQLSDDDGLLNTAEDLSKDGDITIETTGGNYLTEFKSNHGAGYDTSTKLNVYGVDAFGILNHTGLLSAENNVFQQYRLLDTGNGDDGTHDLEMRHVGEEITLKYENSNEDRVTVNQELQTLNVTANDEVIFEVDGNNVLEMFGDNVQVGQELRTQAIVAQDNISSTGTVGGTAMLADNYMTIGDSQGAPYYLGGGVSNMNYLNITSLSDYETSATIAHDMPKDQDASDIEEGGVYRIVDPGNTDFTTVGAPNNLADTIFTATGDDPGGDGTVKYLDQFHQSLRFLAWMGDEDYFHNRNGFFAAVENEADGTRNVGEFLFVNRVNGNQGFELGLDNYEFGDDNFVTTTLLADHRQVRFGSPAALQHVSVGSTLPTDPDIGERFIHNGVLKIYADTVWNNYDPEDGSMVYDNTNNRTLVRENGSWRVITTTAL